MSTASHPRPQRALVCGIDYVDTPSWRLSGCQADAQAWHQVLLQQLGFRAKDVLLLTDTPDSPLPPTRVHLEQSLRELALWTHRAVANDPGARPLVMFVYAGHGTEQADDNGDERDRRDSALVPSDAQTAGYLVDDTLGAWARKLHPFTTAVCIYDACHSGTMGDLPWRWVGGSDPYQQEDTQPVRARVVSLSACRDVGVAQEAWDDVVRQTRGALSLVLQRLLTERQWRLRCEEVMQTLQDRLGPSGQVPQLCSSVPLSPDVWLALPDKERPLLWQQGGSA